VKRSNVVNSRELEEMLKNWNAQSPPSVHWFHSKNAQSFAQQKTVRDNSVVPTKAMEVNLWRFQHLVTGLVMKCANQFTTPNVQLSEPVLIAHKEDVVFISQSKTLQRDWNANWLERKLVLRELNNDANLLKPKKVVEERNVAFTESKETKQDWSSATLMELKCAVKDLKPNVTKLESTKELIIQTVMQLNAANMESEELSNERLLAKLWEDQRNVNLSSTLFVKQKNKNCLLESIVFKRNAVLTQELDSKSSKEIARLFPNLHALGWWLKDVHYKK
jgi:hypothetical protein